MSIARPDATLSRPPRAWMLAIALLTACGEETSPSDTVALPPFEDSELDAYEVAVVPDFSVFETLQEMDLEPVVMVNLLRFRDQATGDGFEGMTGQEAYGEYVAAISDEQVSIGSRLIWAGDVDAQVVGASDPVFHTAALLEYASVDAFIGYASSIPAEAAAARSAGLEGQWLVAATTVKEDDGVLGDSCGDAVWSIEDAVGATGLSSSQVTRLLDGPTDEPVLVLELLRSNGERAELDAYLDAMASVQAELGAKPRWRGELVLQLLGTASPGFELLLATEYPSRHCYLTALSHERVTALAQQRANSTELHWIYAATSRDSAL